MCHLARAPAAVSHRSSSALPTAMPDGTGRRRPPGVSVPLLYSRGSVTATRRSLICSTCRQAEAGAEVCATWRAHRQSFHTSRTRPCLRRCRMEPGRRRPPGVSVPLLYSRGSVTATPGSLICSICRQAEARAEACATWRAPAAVSHQSNSALPTAMPDGNGATEAPGRFRAAPLQSRLSNGDSRVSHLFHLPPGRGWPSGIAGGRGRVRHGAKEVPGRFRAAPLQSRLGNGWSLALRPGFGGSCYAAASIIF